MKCPSCGYKNIGGADECEACHVDLASLDGVVPKTRIEKVLMSDPISRLQPRKPVVVKKDASVLAAVRAMNTSKVGCALVTDGDDLEGILTERDVIGKGLAQKKDLSRLTVSEIMTADPEALTEDDTLAYAVNRMSLRGFRHIPIVRNEKPAGIISVRDLLRYLSKLFP